MSRMPRRTFLSMTLLSAAAAPLLPRADRANTSASAATGAARGLMRPFALRAVRLRPGPLLDALEVNRRFLMTQDPDRLLHMFRLTAGLPSSAAPLGGWEAPDNELRGHFTGHYMSACALLAAQTGDAAVRSRGIVIADQLARCQAAIGTGYVSAFPVDLFDRLRVGQPAWAPFYTLHKIMAGLFDTWQLSGERQARDTLLGLARWTERWVQPLSDAEMARVLEREYGGMNEVLYNLADATADARWQTLAQRFNRGRILEPLAAGRDELQGLHANTTIPQIIGAARGYEVSGSPQLRQAAETFWHTVTKRRSYCTGGTSEGEHWNGAPGMLAHELSGYTEESCCTYNMHKLTRHLFAWSADPRLGDYYERALFNGILGVQHPADGDKLYYLALAGGYWKLFGTPFQDYWCCTGSMSESFAKLGDSIYFHDDAGVYVNLFIASELHWAERGVRLAAWSGPALGQLNGEKLAAPIVPGSWLTLEREWRNEDELELRLPMRLHTVALPGDASLQAVMYGPLVLAGRLGTEGLDAKTLRAGPTRPRTVPEYTTAALGVPVIAAPSPDPERWLAPLEGQPLEFRTVGQARELALVPLNSIFDERYAVYWRIDTDTTRGSG